MARDDKKPGPPPRIAPPPATPAKHPPTKSLANTLMGNATNASPAAGKGAFGGGSPQPAPAPDVTAPVEHGPEREKRDKNRKK